MTTNMNTLSSNYTMHHALASTLFVAEPGYPHTFNTTYTDVDGLLF